MRTSRSWSVQDQLNGFPVWSRSRQRRDSVLAQFLNPVGVVGDEIREALFRAQQNSYIETVDLNDQSSLYVVRLPTDFEFSIKTDFHGKHIYNLPTVTCLDGVDSVSIEIAEDSKLQSIYKSEALPTRIKCSQLTSSFENEVMPLTPLSSIADAVLNDIDLDTVGVIWVTVDDATQFGEAVTETLSSTPAILIKGVPRDEESTYTEHLVFRTNATLRSRTLWKSLESVSSVSVYGDDATVRITKGFNENLIQEAEHLWITPDRRVRYFNGFSNETFLGDVVPYVQYSTFDIASPNLRVTEGIPDTSVEYEFALMDEDWNSLEKELVGLTRQPFTEFYVASTEDQLLFFSSKMPSETTLVNESSTLKNTILSAALIQRTADCELILDVDSNYVTPTSGFIIPIATRRVKEIGELVKVRLSLIIDGPTLASPEVRYFDFNGTLLDPLIHPTQAWLLNEDFSRKRLDLDIELYLEHPVLVAVVKLEAYYRLNDTTHTEIDTGLFFFDGRVVEKSLNWPAELEGKVSGIQFDGDQRLLVCTDDDEVWLVELVYDRGVMSFNTQTLYLVEEYDSITVEA